MTAAVRKKDEELTINLKCRIGVLMTDSEQNTNSTIKRKERIKRRKNFVLKLYCFNFADVHKRWCPTESFRQWLR